jgi:hypothetical protein
LVSFDGSVTAGQEDYVEGLIAAASFPQLTLGWSWYFAGVFKSCLKAPAVNSSLLLSHSGGGNRPRYAYEDSGFTHKYSFTDTLAEHAFSAFSPGGQVLSYIWSPGVGAPAIGTTEVFSRGVSLGSSAYSVTQGGLSDYRLGDFIPGGQPCFMDLALVLWFSRQHDSSQRQAIERWIRIQFGY